MSPLFEGLLINNAGTRGVLARARCMAIQRPKKITTKLKIKNTYASGLFGKPFLFTKNKLKETPI